MLETERLILRPFLEENLPIMLEMFQDKDFMAFHLMVPYQLRQQLIVFRNFGAL